MLFFLFISVLPESSSYVHVFFFFFFVNSGYIKTFLFCFVSGTHLY